MINGSEGRLISREKEGRSIAKITYGLKFLEICSAV